MKAYISERTNGTFAEAATGTGETIGVSFWLADPPGASHFCIHCTGINVSGLLEEPVVVCAGNDVAIIRVAYRYGARRLESWEDLGAADLDYFVYRAAHSGNPTLRLLPNPKPIFFGVREVGVLPSADGEDFLMAVVEPRRVMLQYDLHVFSSKTNCWTTKLALLEPPSPIRYKTDEYLVHKTDKVISLGGGVLGWVDLWRGILTCDVLATDPVLHMHYIQFPEPMGDNLCRHLVTPAQVVRDVTCSNNGVVKLVEIEEQSRLVAPAAPSNDDLRNDLHATSFAGLENEDAMATCTTTSESIYIVDGWTVVTWKRNTTDHWGKEWTRDCGTYVNKSSISSLLSHSHPEILALESLAIAGPVWSMHGEDVCYLMGEAVLEDKNAWAITIDMRKNTLEGLNFSPQRELFFSPTYHPFALSKYLNMTRDDWKVVAAARAQVQEEKEDSSNDPSNTTLLVEDLDSFITKSQLKAILQMFGDLHYLKFFEDERYAEVQFVYRSCAEETMSKLNGAQIGRRCLRFSWKTSIPNIQAHHEKSSGRDGGNYHPYARLRGFNSHSNTSGRSSRK